jgi:hypothetical protein
MAPFVLALSAGGVVVGLLVGLVSRQASSAVAALLELWMAAGLLRLTADASWAALGSAASIVALRTIAKAAFRSAQRTRAAREPGRFNGRTGTTGAPHGAARVDAK